MAIRKKTKNTKKAKKSGDPVVQPPRSAGRPGASLSAEEVERFYGVWMPLLVWVNEQRQVVSPAELPRKVSRVSPEVVSRVRDALWSDDSLLDRFVATNPLKLEPRILDIAAGWRHRVAGEFILLKHYARYSVFLKDERAFCVGGLASPLAEMFPRPPVYLKAFLIPYEDTIIYDSMLATFNVSFGGGARRSFMESFDTAKKSGEVYFRLPIGA